MRVPCGDCVACCSSSRFIHIRPEEAGTIDRIPKKMLFPAPLRPAGYFVMGYDTHGRCPMLARNCCSIYRNRPSTCRTFDCRVLAASGFDAEGGENNQIMQQAKRWQFRYATAYDRRLHTAVRDAAVFLNDHPECLHRTLHSSDRIQIAVLAIKVYTVFLKRTGFPVNNRRPKNNSTIIQEVVRSCEKFEKRLRVGSPGKGSLYEGN
jgi:uncharacterized protein